MTAIIIVSIICLTVTVICLASLYIYYCKRVKEWDCEHDYKTYSETEVKDDFGGINYDVTLICKKCGKIKKVRLRL